jgi:glycogen debranching enzyme
MDWLKQSIYIARSSLLSCNTQIGVCAGAHHFVDLWARDSLFATFGLFSKNELREAKTTIETFLRYQRSDGLIPYRILRSKASFAKYFGYPTYLSVPKPNFRSYQSGGIVPDGGLMTIIAAAEYMRRSKDKQFITIHKTQLLNSLAWYTKQFGENLITEWFLCEWADAVLKAGCTLYTNILYWKALGDMGMLTKQKMLGTEIQKQFWTGNYFADWIDWKRQDYLSSHGNLLAIVFGFCTRKQSLSILSHIKKKNDYGWTVDTNAPKYPPWRIPVWNYLVGMGDYHNRGCLWLQSGILYALALEKVGRQKEAAFRLLCIAKQIVRWNGVYEVYERNGSPVNRLFYKSEHPFAWSAGLFVWASSMIGRQNYDSHD